MPHGFLGLQRIHKRPIAQGASSRAPSAGPPVPPPAPRPSKRPHPPSGSSDLSPESDSGDEERTVKKTTKKHLPPRAANQQAEHVDQPHEVADSQQARKKRKVYYDPDIVQRYETVVLLAKYDARVEAGVEYLYQAARVLPRFMGTFVNYDLVLTAGLARDGKSADDDREAIDKVWDEDHEVAWYFRVIKDQFPGFSEHTAYLRQRPDLVSQLAKWMKAVAGKARSSDITRIKDNILFLAKVPQAHELTDKTRRGFKNTVTGRLLCPVKYLPKFDAEPERFCRMIRDSHDDRPRIRAKHWPTFLYDMKQYVPGKAKPGLLKSALMLQAYQLLYTGLSSAKASAQGDARRKGKGKPSVAHKMEMSVVFPTSIIYVATLLHFTLNSQVEWEETDGDFDGWEFSRSLLTCMLKDRKWADEICEWYRIRVFGGGAPDSDDSDDEPSAFDLFLEEIDDAQENQPEKNNMPLDDDEAEEDAEKALASPEDTELEAALSQAAGSNNW
ncbi:hypothetical protein OH77DRAFT_1476744 [Trametes cingulata]|nr:hypothetical protein OH77DRAFT_1476744 [Trametes cingulata]